MSIKILLGGSPCTHWSIAQKNGRETEPSGLGWELFRNYLIAKDKFKPDYFLYENNKSAAQPIKDQISKELGVPLQYINSALVSAQNRQRFYAHNIPNVEQPEDRGILLKDILESGIVDKEKAYCLKHQAGNARDYFKKHHTQIAFEPVPINAIDGKARTIKSQYAKTAIANTQYNSTYGATMVAESIRIPDYGDNTKARPLNALYPNHAGVGEGSLEQRLCSDNPNKQQVDLVAEPIRIGTIESGERSAKSDSQTNRVYSTFVKSTTLNANGGGGGGAKTGLYACPIEPLLPFTEQALCETANKYGYLPIMSNPYNKTEITDKSPTITACSNRQSNSGQVMMVQPWNGKTCPVYQVIDGLITIKENQYPIKLPDGYYIIRKLTVKECMRLQTVPEWYIFPVSNTQAYKMLGNGWTVEVIKHILSYIPDITNCDIEVLSMYDGMACGMIALRGLGCKVVKYKAYEIDKYAIQTTQHNFPEIIQCGDAFQVRADYWQF